MAVHVLCRAGPRVIVVLSRTAVIVWLPSIHSVSVIVTSKTVSTTSSEWLRLLSKGLGNRVIQAPFGALSAHIPANVAVSAGDEWLFYS